MSFQDSKCSRILRCERDAWTLERTIARKAGFAPPGNISKLGRLGQRFRRYDSPLAWRTDFSTLAGPDDMANPVSNRR